MEKQISIIIPTYNMEAYIGKCLDSLLIPQLNQVEVWVVNDGSKDRSSEIANSYADRYPNSIHVLDKPNGNYGSCINAALPLCTGRYVKVLDADDTFETQAFIQYVDTLSQCNEDCIITKYITKDIEHKIIEVSKYPLSLKINESLTFEHIANTLINRYLQMHSITYNREIFSRLQYKQTEGVSYTDAQWAITLISYCQSFRCLDLALYSYLIGREGQTVDKEVFNRSIGPFFSMLKGLVKQYNQFSGPKEHSEHFKYMVTMQHDYIYRTILSNLSEHNIKLLQDYEMSLQSECKDVYDAIAEIKYSPEVNYYIFNEFRKQSYPINFSIPKTTLLKLSCKVKIRKFIEIITKHT